MTGTERGRWMAISRMRRPNSRDEATDGESDRVEAPPTYSWVVSGLSSSSTARLTPPRRAEWNCGTRALPCSSGNTADAAAGCWTDHQRSPAQRACPCLVYSAGRRIRTANSSRTITRLDPPRPLGVFSDSFAFRLTEPSAGCVTAVHSCNHRSDCSPIPPARL